jgi:hypothetical protein
MKNATKKSLLMSGIPAGLAPINPRMTAKVVNLYARLLATVTG